ncbi:uncharacterized protein B0I36DRAFT_351565 [Microdochium trichocladiopsis]|uniref:BZIP domain-containing protein n=1 Tax=Microdochium trichocladiopsis TaxID=1682393 RepID=A0A9P8Y5R8_9PEZI|nr:uncharacterized protein B0I36DRAFT_351565 [Microdochium trichocladiopsis]KAH7028145.1 hypothetical protein B0I36DRAFT_351565 [Microdochium trichocladiopsis]
MSGPREHQHPSQSHFGAVPLSSPTVGTTAAQAQAFGLGHSRGPASSPFQYDQQQQQQQFSHGQPTFQSLGAFMPQSTVDRHPGNVTVPGYGIVGQPETVPQSPVPLAPQHRHHESIHLPAEQPGYSQPAALRGANTERYNDAFPAWKTEPADNASSVALGNKSAPPSQRTWPTETTPSRVGKRPRLETAENEVQPDTAEDETEEANRLDQRRRTQIRLAQRAYRSRKETAMNDLEGQVKRLKDDNVEMREAVHDLVNCANQYSHLLIQMPELARHLHKVRALTKTRKSSARSEDSTSEDVHDRSTLDDSEPIIKSEESKDFSSHGAKPNGQSQQLLGSTAASYDGHDSHGYGAYQSRGSSEYEVIAVPTHDNASFAPNKIDLSADFLQGMPWTGQPQLSAFPLPHADPSPMSGFGRRLQRHAREKIATLLSMTNPPAETILRVLGFSSVFESQEEVRRRINEDLQRSRDEVMYNMQFPYYTDGGSTSQYVDRHQQAPPAGAPNHFKSGSSYQSGSAEIRASDLRGRLLEICKAMQLPIARSVIWDCDEVNLYLTQRGVSLSNANEACTVEINPMAFLTQDSSASQLSEVPHMVGHAANDGQPNDGQFNEVRWNNPPSSTFGGPVPPESSSSSAGEPRKMAFWGAVTALT